VSYRFWLLVTQSFRIQQTSRTNTLLSLFDRPLSTDYLIAHLRSTLCSISSHSTSSHGRTHLLLSRRSTQNQKPNSKPSNQPTNHVLPSHHPTPMRSHLPPRPPPQRHHHTPPIATAPHNTSRQHPIRAAPHRRDAPIPRPGNQPSHRDDCTSRAPAGRTYKPLLDRTHTNLRGDGAKSVFVRLFQRTGWQRDGCYPSEEAS